MCENRNPPNIVIIAGSVGFFGRMPVDDMTAMVNDGGTMLKSD